MTDGYEAALACLRRYRSGWKARRDGCGFLCWNRGPDWEQMTDGEARVWWSSDPAEARAGLSSTQGDGSDRQKGT